MRLFYLDTSIAGSIVLGQSPSAAEWFDTVTAGDETIVSSRVLRTELTRLLRREQLDVVRREAVCDFVSFVALDHAVLLEAEAIVPHLKTLDAIHLATALRVGVDDLVVATHDSALATVAAHLGFATVDPIND